MIVITMLDGEKIDIHPDTVLVGMVNLPRGTTPEQNVFYLQQGFVGSINENHLDNDFSLGTSDERLGITGFLISYPVFSVGEGVDKTIYFTSAVKSVSVI